MNTIVDMDIPPLYPQSITTGPGCSQTGVNIQKIDLQRVAVAVAVAVFNLVAAEMRALIDVLAGTRSVNPVTGEMRRQS